MVANMRAFLHTVTLLIAVSQVSAFLKLDVDQHIERDHDLDVQQHVKADHQLDADQQLDDHQQHETQSDAELRQRLVDGMTEHAYRRHILGRSMDSEQLFNLVHYGLQTEVGKRNYSLVDLSKLAVSNNQTEPCSLPEVERLRKVGQGNLECVRKVGQGSFGTVYEVKVTCAEKGETQTLAVKQQKNPCTISSPSAEESVDCEVLKSEIELLADVTPGLSPYLLSTVGGRRGVQTVGDQEYLTTEFLNAGDYDNYQFGSSFATYAKKYEDNYSLADGRKIMLGPSLEWKLPLLVHVLKGMKAMHEAGYAHLDMKPANVMVHCKERNEDNSSIPSSCYAQVIDLGLSQLIQDRGNIVGTPVFVAPEVWRASASQESMKVRPASDVFAAGAMLYMDVFEVGMDHLPWVIQNPDSGASRDWYVEKDAKVKQASSSDDPFLKKLGETLKGMLSNNENNRISMDGSIAALEYLVRLSSAEGREASKTVLVLKPSQRFHPQRQYCRKELKIWSKTNSLSRCPATLFSDDYCPGQIEQYCFDGKVGDVKFKGVCCCMKENTKASWFNSIHYTATERCSDMEPFLNKKDLEDQKGESHLGDQSGLLAMIEKSPIQRGITSHVPECMMASD